MSPSMGLLSKLPTVKPICEATSLISFCEKNAIDPAKWTGTVLISSLNCMIMFSANNFIPFLIRPVMYFESLFKYMNSAKFAK